MLGLSTFWAQIRAQIKNFSVFRNKNDIVLLDTFSLPSMDGLAEILNTDIIPVGSKKPRSMLVDEQNLDLYSISEFLDNSNRLKLIVYHDQNSMDILYRWCKQVFEYKIHEPVSSIKKDLVITFLLKNGTFKNVYLRGCFPTSRTRIQNHFGVSMIEIELSYDFSR